MVNHKHVGPGGRVVRRLRLDDGRVALDGLAHEDLDDKHAVRLHVAGRRGGIGAEVNALAVRVSHGRPGAGPSEPFVHDWLEALRPRPVEQLLLVDQAGVVVLLGQHGRLFGLIPSKQTTLEHLHFTFTIAQANDQKSSLSISER